MKKQTARQLGYISERDLEHGNLIPRREAQPAIIRGERHYHREHCEPLVTRQAAEQMGLRVPPDAEPERRIGMYFVHRVSDLIPFQAREATDRPAERIRLLDAIYIVARSARNYARAEQSHVDCGNAGLARDANERRRNLTALGERGIAAAVKTGELQFIGVNGVNGVYAEPRSTYRSVHAGIIPADAELPEQVESNEWFPCPRGRLKDAVCTLMNLPEVDGFIRLKSADLEPVTV